MFAILINLLIFALICSVAYYIITLIPLPLPIKNVVMIIFLLFVLLSLLSGLIGYPTPNWLAIRLR